MASSKTKTLLIFKYLNDYSDENNPLSTTDLIDLLMKDVNARLAEKELSIELSDEAKSLIAREAYDPVYGARPLKRYLQKNVETLAARKILSGEVDMRDVIRIEADGDSLKAEVIKG